MSDNYQPTTFSVDALVPQAMAEKMEAVGEAKVGLGPLRILALAVLAGAFIALGAIFSTTVTAGGSALPYGLSRLIGGLAFCLGLILVIGAGAELFTGNNLIVMAWAHKRVSTGRLLGNWAIVYAGNFVGALGTVLLLYTSKQWTLGGGAIGLNALNTANAKSGLDFFQALVLGILCNVLVCLAVWLCIGARSATDKILAIIFPITAFVAAGFEHSVANMYFIPAGLLIKAGAPADFWTQIGKTPADFGNLTAGNFLWNNLVPVTIGNIIGGAVMVGLVYWFIYLRPNWINSPAQGAAGTRPGMGQA